VIGVWIAVAVLVLAAGALVPVFAGRGRRVAGDGAEIAARDRYELLGHYVENPVATDDGHAAELLRQGRERWNSAGAVLASARTEPEFLLAERVAGEGLAHVAAAYARLGLAGPPAS
jgi:hypothetical protein